MRRFWLPNKYDFAVFDKNNNLVYLVEVDDEEHKDKHFGNYDIYNSCYVDTFLGCYKNVQYLQNTYYIVYLAWIPPRDFLSKYAV